MQLQSIRNIFRIPKSFNTNISHQLFDYTITLLIHNARTQIIEVTYTKKQVLKVRFQDFWYTKINLSQKYILINF